MNIALTFTFRNYEFFAPHWLWLLFLVPVFLFILARQDKKRSGDWKFTGTANTQQRYSSPFIRYIRLGFGLLILCAYSAVVFALSKPVNWNTYEHVENNYKNGIDIILAIDISGSMDISDFPPNRLEAAKKVAKEFVDGRKSDRIGLVAYAGEAYTACPATTDYTVLKKQIDGLHTGSNILDGTAIGVGLGTAVTRLRNDSIQSKVIILLTDGSNNSGDISPDEAASLAKAKNIRVYTIGMGAKSEESFWGLGGMGGDLELDEQTLKSIANIADGKYFRATDVKSLQQIYKEIETMEKRKMIDHSFQSEPPAMPESFIGWAIALCLVFWLGTHLLFRQNG